MVESMLNSDHPLHSIFHNPNHFVVGILLMLANSLIVISIGALFFHVVKPHSESTAILYFAARLVEGIVLAAGIMSYLSLVPLAAQRETSTTPDAEYFQTMTAVAAKGMYWAYQIAMLTLGLGSLPFCVTLYRSQLVPTVLAALGVVGYFILFLGALLELFGYPYGVAMSTPGGLFELILPFWLFVMGFNDTNQENLLQE